MARIVRQVEPRIVYVENSAQLVGLGLGRVLSDLAGMGYNARWGVLGGFAVGSCINGKRLWLYAHKADCKRLNADKVLTALVGGQEARVRQYDGIIGATIPEEANRRLLRDSDALAIEMDRLRAIGNGQDPFLAAAAFEILANG
jgi:DNA (cytosine-5)-methyltransferase 1